MKKSSLFLLLLFLFLNAFSADFKGNGAKKGYRGFIDFGYTENYRNFRVIHYEGYLQNSDRYEFSTTHGYQFNSHFFFGVGGGVACLYNLGYSGNTERGCLEHHKTHHKDYAIHIPVYGVFRYNILNNKITPFVELKGGYTFGEDHEHMFWPTWYFSPMAGCRFGLNKVLALNVKIGYTMQLIDYYRYMELDGYDLKRNFDGFTTKIEFEF